MFLYELRFVDGDSGNGPILLLEFTTPSVDNSSGASDITTNSATLNGTLTSTGAAPTYVTICWGPTDGGTNFSGWTNVVPFPGQRAAGAFSTNISGLTTSTLYYYRACASNSCGLTWAAATTNFTTLSVAPPGTLQFATNTYSVDENAGNMTVTVTRVAGTNGLANVQFATASGTALAGTNFIATNGTLSWAAGESGGKTAVVGILNDGVYGAHKSFTVVLSNPSVASLVSPGTATVTIVENSPGSLQFSSATASVNEDAGSLTLTVIRTGGSNGVASIQYTTAAGTAVADTDYTTTNGTLSWANGDRGGKTFAIIIRNDGLYTVDKLFSAVLSNPSGASLSSPGTATVTIVENSPGTLQFAAAAASVNKDAGSVTLTITRSGGSNSAATVHYATHDATALAGSNYTAVSGTLSWSHAEQANKTIAVPILNSSQDGVNKLFTVELSTASGAGLGTPATETITIVDNDTPPAAPTGLAASHGSFADKVRLTWNASSQATSYVVYRNMVNDSASATAFGAEPTTNSYDDTAATAGTIYYYWVKAKNGIGSSTFSASASGYVSQAVVLVVSPLAADFDGDGKVDPTAVVSNAAWHIWLSSGGYGHSGPYVFSAAADAVPLAADFDGDGRADPAMMTPASGNWTIWLSGSGYAPVGPYRFGLSASDLPAPGDFDGDSKADPAVYCSGQWTVWLSGSGYGQVGPALFSVSGSEIPAPADFDGDGLADPAVYMAGLWTAWPSASGYAKAGPFVFSVTGEELPVPGDFDGDGLTDPAICTPDYTWYIWLSGSGYARTGPHLFSPEQ